jgi:hypothetical protein
MKVEINKQTCQLINSSNYSYVYVVENKEVNIGKLIVDSNINDNCLVFDSNSIVLIMFHWRNKVEIEIAFGSKRKSCRNCFNNLSEDCSINYSIISGAIVRQGFIPHWKRSSIVHVVKIPFDYSL